MRQYRFPDIDHRTSVTIVSKNRYQALNEAARLGGLYLPRKQRFIRPQTQHRRVRS